MNIASNENQEVRVFMPQNELKQKTGDGGINGADLKKAEKRLEEAVDLFFPMAEKELNRMDEWLAKALRGKESALAKNNIQSAAFEIKSVGGMFNYYTVSDVAKSLFDFCDALQTLKPKALEVVRIHVMLLKLLVKQESEAATGKSRTEIKEILKIFCDKMLRKIG